MATFLATVEGLKFLKNSMDSLMAETTKAGKDTVLRFHNTDKRFKKLLKFLLNNDITTGISAKKLERRKSFSNDIHEENSSQEITNLLSLLDYLKVNNTGRDADIRVVHQYIQNQPEELHDFIEKVVTKSLKLGVTAKTVNAVYGEGFIPVFEVQLAKSIDKLDAERLKGLLGFITLKLDGHRTLAQISFDGFNGIGVPVTIGEQVRIGGRINVNFFTRQGKPVAGMTDVATSIFNSFDWNKLAKVYPEGLFLDGEILITESDKPKEEWFNETSKIIRKDGEKSNLTYHVFDIVGVDEFFQDKKSILTYKDRRNMLNDLYLDNPDAAGIELVPVLMETQDVYDELEAIYKLFDEQVALGEEGLMLNLDTPYECKRHNGLLKIKPTKSADLEIIGFEPGAPYTKYENTLGALIMDFEGVPVKFGSGLTDELRDEIWNNQDKYLGAIGEIQYTSYSKNQNNDEISLRFPRFKGIRTDKSVEDVNIE